MIIIIIIIIIWANTFLWKCWIILYKQQSHGPPSQQQFVVDIKFQKRPECERAVNYQILTVGLFWTEVGQMLDRCWTVAHMKACVEIKGVWMSSAGCWDIWLVISDQWFSIMSSYLTVTWCCVSSVCPLSCDCFRDVKRVLFVPYALHDRDAYTRTARDKFKSLGRCSTGNTWHHHR